MPEVGWAPGPGGEWGEGAACAHSLLLLLERLLLQA
jgi:hypothetical protein